MFVFPPSTLTWLVNTLCLWRTKTWIDDTSNHSTHSKYEFKPLGSAHSPRGGRSVCFHIHECGIGSGWILYMHVYVACIISSSFKGLVTSTHSKISQLVISRLKLRATNSVIS